MNIRWLWLDHIPPELGITREQRNEIARLVRQKRIEEPRYRASHRGAGRFILVSGILLSIAFTIWIFVLVALRLRPAMLIVTNVSSILLFNALLWTCITWAWFRSNAVYVRWALCGVGKPVCINCGYILTGA